MQRSRALAAILLAAASAGLAAAPTATASGLGGGANPPDLPASSRPALAREAERGTIGRAELARRLGKLARKAPGASGYYVYDLEAKRRRVLFDRSEGTRRRLASNEKLFTTSTALHRLGPKGRIATRVKRRGKVSAAGRLKGSLYLIGGGDPSLGAAGMNDLAHDVARAGIERVSGTVIGDDTVFDRRRGVPDTGWAAGPDIAPLSGLVYGGSTYERDPARDAAAALKDALRRAGVRIGGKVHVGELPGKLRTTPALGEYRSPTIAALVAATNKPSNNFFAEMLLKRLWAKPGREGTTAGGAKAVERYARKRGSGVSALDGSGLTDNNLSSPREVVRLLNAMRHGRDAGAFYSSLAKAGKEGTLDDRMEGTAAAGRCRGKTGTIDGVSNLSGYCRSGKHLVAFSLLMNGVGDYDAARNIQDEMTIEIARYRP